MSVNEYFLWRHNSATLTNVIITDITCSDIAPWRHLSIKRISMSHRTIEVSFLEQVSTMIMYARSGCVLSTQLLLPAKQKRLRLCLDVGAAQYTYAAELEQRVLGWFCCAMKYTLPQSANNTQVGHRPIIAKRAREDKLSRKFPPQMSATCIHHSIHLT